MSKKSGKLTIFEKCIVNALRHIHDRTWLTQQSPLSASYLFDFEHKISPNAPHMQGQLLQQALQMAADTLFGIGTGNRDTLLKIANEQLEAKNLDQAYAYALLDATYFHRYLKPSHTDYIWSENPLTGETALFPMGRATYHRHRDQAIRELAVAFLRLHRPSLHPETLPFVEKLIGRETVLETCFQQLGAGKTVTLRGAAGVGKSAVGAEIGKRWASSALFWLTIRPTINDNLYAFLFELANFLIHQADGANALWQHLIANANQALDTAVAMGLLRHDLAHIADKQPLLCLDNVNQLLDTRENHQQLRLFLSGLQQSVPILLIGEDVLGDTIQITLEPFDPAETSMFLQMKRLGAADEMSAALQACTAGNPRLLMIAAALHQKKEMSWHKIADAMTESFAVDRLFETIWAHLSAAEKSLLVQMSPFRRPIPLVLLADVTEMSLTLQSLVQYGLVIRYEDGTAEPLVYVRQGVYQRVMAEHRQQLHRWAGLHRVQMGQFTSAAYHLIQAGERDLAVTLWHQHRAVEMEQGQATAALTLFESLSPDTLEGKSSQEKLVLIQAELLRLHGSLVEAKERIDESMWRPDSAIRFDAAMLNGDLTLELNGAEKAITAYDTAYADGTQMVVGLVRVHLKRGLAYWQQRNLQGVHNEATMARGEFERLQGLAQFYQGDLGAAEISYRLALTIAQQLNHIPLQGRVYLDLAILYATQTDIDAAEVEYRLGEKALKQHGDQYLLEMARVNMSALYIKANQPERAIEIAQSALDYFVHSPYAYVRTVLYLNLGQAWLDSGNDEQAMVYVQQVIATEEEALLPNAFLIAGAVSVHEEAWEDAERFFGLAQQIAAGAGDEYILAYVDQAFGELCLAQEDMVTAEQYLGRALNAFIQMNIKDKIKKTQQLLKSHQFTN